MHHQDAEVYQNCKGWFSVNVQTVSDPDLLIQSIVACWPDSYHDSTIYNAITLRAQFENEEFQNFVLIDDSGYAVSRHLLTPLQNVNSEVEDLYNE